MQTHSSIYPNAASNVDGAALCENVVVPSTAWIEIYSAVNRFRRRRLSGDDCPVPPDYIAVVVYPVGNAIVVPHIAAYAFGSIG